MDKRLFLSAIFLFITITTIYILNTNTIPTISYFPFDDRTTYDVAQTNLNIKDNESNTYSLTWESQSKSSEPLYLRQDVSLLYENGKFKGVQSKWVENVDTIHLMKRISSGKNRFFQAITYHHGEIHYPHNKINSIQKMSYNYLYVLTPPDTFLHSFKSPKGIADKRWKDLLDQTTKQHLLYYWNRLLTYYNINKDAYLSVPLTNLYKYENENLPGLTNDQTNQIIGQLWEGLYKNYIVPAANVKGKTDPHYVPLLLFDKENTHLIVLFELNGKKEKLIQHYPK